MDIPAAAITTLISSGIATSVTLLINRGNGLKNLNDQLDNILKISIQYPYLENTVFTSTWNKNKNSTEDKYLRYDNYCNLVFNYMERLCKYYNYDERKIQEHINIKDWIRVHKQCWSNPSTPYENSDGYSKELKKLLTHFLQ
ncbi:MAG: hypothetical protein LC111_00220 [Bacteroidia bacterium]|nr:hypothetical protein [Bacteroidia bacterium]